MHNKFIASSQSYADCVISITKYANTRQSQIYIIINKSSVSYLLTG